MKHLFSLCAAVPLVLLLQVSGAQGAAEGGAFSIPEDAATRAAIERDRARSQQCFLLRSQGVAALKKNDIKKAETLLKQALSFDPTDGEACVRLAEMHMRSKQPEAAVADLEPIVNPRLGSTNSVGSEITTRMLYVLAQLDCGKWGAAAACYEKSFRPDLAWSLPGGGPTHKFPNVRFSPENPDFLGLRAQAHLILGAYQPHYVEQQDRPQYMLDQLREALKYNPRSLDAAYLSGWMLAKMERFPEARAAYEKAMRLVSKEARPEVQQALQDLKTQEERKAAHDARITARQ